MLKIREAIVVEGRYDKIALSSVVDTAIFTTEGFGIFRDPEKLSFLRAVAERRGLIAGRCLAKPNSKAPRTNKQRGGERGSA